MEEWFRVRREWRRWFIVKREWGSEVWVLQEGCLFMKKKFERG
jgi:hypothetical protein